MPPTQFAVVLERELGHGPVFSSVAGVTPDVVRQFVSNALGLLPALRGTYGSAPLVDLPGDAKALALAEMCRVGRQAFRGQPDGLRLLMDWSSEVRIVHGMT